MFDFRAHFCVFRSQSLVLLVQVRELGLTIFVRDFERGVTSNTSLLRQLLVLFVKLGSLVFLLSKLCLSFIKLVVQSNKFQLVALVLSLNVLHLFTSVREHDDMVDDLSTQTSELFVSLFDLLVKSLILNLELLVIDQMETLSQLFFLLEHFLLVGKSVSQSDILQTVLMNFLIFGVVLILPVFNDFLGQFFACSAVDGVHCN